jgi:hypothetical protein
MPDETAVGCERGSVGPATGGSEASAAHRSGYEKLKTALHALVDAFGEAEQHGEEQFRAEKGDDPRPNRKPPQAPSKTSIDSKASGHGRNGDAAFESARKVETRHQQLKSGDRLLHGVTAPAAELLANPAECMPWNYRDTMNRIAGG